MTKENLPTMRDDKVDHCDKNIWGMYGFLKILWVLVEFFGWTSFGLESALKLTFLNTLIQQDILHRYIIRPIHDGANC